ncbi:MAG TPA: winged helix-turn-helix transcriptional regulator [Candidatus Thermoplasmatota archaeon]|nr:winged helix-turn-helix transcriptional regulator [Candidatus Thermoplasmatota archaeon]
MGPLRLAVALAAALVLASPGALAAVASGELTAGAVALDAASRADTAGLDVLRVGDGVPEVALELRDVVVQRFGHARVVVGGPASASHTLQSIDERAEFASATLTLASGEGEQLVALRAAGPAVATLGASHLRGVGGALLAAAAGSDGTSCAGAAIPDYCLDVFGVYELAGDARVELAGGEVILLLFGPTARLASGGATRDFASGPRSAEEAGPAARAESAWVVVRAREAAGVVDAGDARLFSPAPTIRTTGATFADAEGVVRMGARSYRASADDVTAHGQLVLAPGPVARAGDHGIDGETVYASSFTTRISGDVTSIDLNAAPVFLDTPAQKAGFFGLLALLAAGVVYAWQHIAFLAAALYTRLNKPDILDNDVRNRIYDIIRENPGISAREVHRRSEQSWGTVVYHLRQLERHHLVVSRALGRTRNYYENHGKYRGMEVQLACLQSDRALALARAIAATPGITQEALAQASGFPQPTTSYYVRKLKQAGLVEEQREGRYVRYVPHADLPRFIAISEQTATVGAAAAKGVQA